MGVYAQTNFTIVCKNKETAKKVHKKLSETKEDEHGNTFGTNLELVKDTIYGMVIILQTKIIIVNKNINKL